jgi:prepilin-type N-terminal cleavage/methylation domain-containing protein/prepilin-type processing-associated H-X9-DG protein
MGATMINRRRSAFTLIELLVVIAIIAILAAVLFPVFATAREKARQSSCQSNLKQIGLGMTQYSQDFDETVPPATFYSPVNSYRSNWVYAIYPYVKSQQVFLCPSDPSSTPVSGTGYWPSTAGFSTPPHISYVYNCNFTMVASDGTHYGAQLSQFAKPAATVAIVDGAAQPPVGVSDPTQWPAKPTAWVLFDISANSPSWTQGLDPGNPINDAVFAAPYARHSGLCNVLWTDGHVKTIRVDNFYNTTGGTQYGTTYSSCLNITTACNAALYSGG